MKIGFVSAILQKKTFEEVIDFAAEHGFKCVEVACWPKGKAERRYAGVTHIDVDALDDDRIKHIKGYCEQKGVAISALAYYPNILDEDEKKRAELSGHLIKVIRASARLGVNLVTTFIGRLESKTVEENLAIAEKVWKPILEIAENEHVKVAIENCPMLFDKTQWPGGQNIFTSPRNWRAFFQRLPSDNLGINFDPSHFVWQMMDYIRPIYEFRDKIFHVHVKDIKLYPEKLNEVGTMGYPLEYMAPKLPGLGDVDWGKYISAITDIGYDGYICLEIEDKAFEKDEDSIEKSLILSKRYIEQFVI